jgi:competence protein ComEC
MDPWAVIAPGFWLSFSAVALIAYVSVGRLAIQHWFKEAVNTQWAVTLGLLPLLIMMFGQTSIVSPIANAFAIPVISLVVVPLAIMGSLLYVDFILYVSHFVLDFCMQGLNWLASLPIATWQQATPSILALTAAIFGVLWLLLPRGFPQRWLGLVLLLPLFFVKPPRLTEGEMQVTALDVGQGLAVVVKTKDHTLLYDAGPRYSTQSDAGSKVVIPFLRGEGIKKLDGFIVSHNDEDHSSGAASVLTQLAVGWFSSSFTQSDTMTLPPNAIKCFAGQHWRWNQVNFEVLYPSWESYENTHLTDNNRSCVVKISSQFGSLLLTGDIEKEAEAVLLQTNNHALSSDVLIVPHHGSKTSSTLEFITAVEPQYSIFTVGYLNRFKHPKPLITERYEKNGALLYRSDFNGALQIDFTHNNRIKIEAWRQSHPRYWHDKY